MMGEREQVYTEGICVLERQELNGGSTIVEIVSVYEKKVYLCLKEDKKNKAYNVYYITKRLYNKTLKYKSAVLDSMESIFIGQMPYGVGDEEWIYVKQRDEKIFGKLKRRVRTVKGYMVLLLLLVIGVAHIGRGIYRIGYEKVLRETVSSTTGSIYKCTRARPKGVLFFAYVENYYNIYVSYSVNGRRYQGFYGTTARIPKNNEEITVLYDSKHPGKIVNFEEYKEDTYYLIYIGCILFGYVILQILIDILKKKEEHRVLTELGLGNCTVENDEKSVGKDSLI